MEYKWHLPCQLHTLYRIHVDFRFFELLTWVPKYLDGEDTGISGKAQTELPFSSCVLVSCIYSSFNLEFLQDSSETHSQPADLYLFYWVRCMRSLSVSPIHRQLMSTQKHLGLIWVKTLNRQWARWREGIWNNSQVHRKDINLSWWKRLSSLGKVERSIIKYPAGSVTFGSRYSRK